MRRYRPIRDHILQALVALLTSIIAGIVVAYTSHLLGW